MRCHNPRQFAFGPWIPFLLFAACAVLLPGQAAIAQANDELRGVVDPVNIGQMRAEFLRITGNDSELSEVEFEQSKLRGNDFVRPFEKWSVLRRFDKDRSGELDWLETASYRSELRSQVLQKFDADGNGRLMGDEREAASKALQAGSVNVLPAQASAAARPDGGAAFETPGDGQQANGRAASALPRPPVPLAQVARQAMQSGDDKPLREGLAIYFVPNGERALTTEEQEQVGIIAKQMVHQQKMQIEHVLRLFDADGDGRITGTERAAMQEHQRMQGEKSRQRALTRWDADGDGRFDAAEQNRMQRDLAAFAQRTLDWNGDGVRSAAEQRQAIRETMQRFDKNNDGAMIDDERAAYEQYMLDLVTSP